MSEEIHTIQLPLPLRMGSVNCYLIQAGAGCLLIDTGAPANRAALEQELVRTGCRPGSLRLILLTHGDFDHTGSAAYLRQKYGAKIAMHPGDAGMAEQADMFSNRPGGSFLLRALVPRLFGFSAAHRFSPDILLHDGFDLSAYGLDACVVEIPGHSSGSVGVLTAAGDLFCGDFWMNDAPEPHLGMGRPAAFQPGIDRLRELRIRMVYPGHGRPFPMDRLQA